MTRFENLGPVGIGRSTVDTFGFNAAREKAPATAPVRVRGKVRLWSSEAQVIVTAEHNARPKVTQERAGGWRIIERQGQLSATTWDGSPPLQIQLQLMLDGKTGLDITESVEDLQNRIRLFGYRVASLGRPPRIRVIGAVPYSAGGITFDATGTPPSWVLEALDFNDLDSLDDGRICQSIATVTLREHVDSSVTTQALAAQRYRSYIWQAHDTLSSVTQDTLGDEDLADWIRDANPAQTKKGWSKVAVGTKIRIPTFRPKS